MSAMCYVINLPGCRQEAEMEEDAEAVRAVDWDRTAADAAYHAEVERAQARARLVCPLRLRALLLDSCVRM